MSLVDLASKAVSVGGKNTDTKSYKTGGTSPDYILDRDWARQSFLLNDIQLGNTTDVSNRYWSSASAKFTDGRLGCNIGINCRPQFSPYTDIRHPGRLSGRAEPTLNETTGNYGMGRYYSEAIDDPAQIIYMRFGLPQFNSLTNFLSRAFDPNQSGLARTGRAPSAFYRAGNVLGTVLAVVSFPAIAIPILAGKVIGAFFLRSTSKYYTMKPDMHLYWSTVNTLVNTLAVNSGIFPKILNDNKDDTQRLGQPFKLDQEYLSMISDLMPDVFSSDNYFDIFALANRAQRLANQVYKDDFQREDNGTISDFVGYLKRENTGDGTHSNKIVDKQGKVSLAQFLNKVTMLSEYFGKEKDQPSKAETDPRIDPNSPEGKERTNDPLNSFAEYFDAEFRSGSQFATFRVDHTGPVSESFSNSVQESDLSQKLNNTSSSARQARFSFAEGNFVGGLVGDVVGTVAGAVKDVALGAIDGVTLGASNIIKGLMGDGYVDIPKHWQSSSASLPRSTYNIQLFTPYGNVVSRIQNLYIPLCMLLAGSLPLSTGKQSYTSPFLCQIFDRGRCQIRLGMIESLTITRGTGALAFDTKGNALAIDISFTVADLSSVMHMPVSSGSFFGVDMTLDEDNILSDYLAVLAGQDIYTQVYPMSAAKLRLAKMAIVKGRLSSPAYWASAIHDSSTSGMLQYLTGGVGNILEGLARGAETTAGSV